MDIYAGSIMEDGKPLDDSYRFDNGEPSDEPQECIHCRETFPAEDVSFRLCTPCFAVLSARRGSK
jgi:hypothetical protein